MEECAYGYVATLKSKHKYKLKIMHIKNKQAGAAQSMVSILFVAAIPAYSCNQVSIIHVTVILYFVIFSIVLGDNK